MKRLAVLLGIMGLGLWLLLHDDEDKNAEINRNPERKKIRKTHFPSKENITM